jgi:hypothetical protein
MAGDEHTDTTAERSVPLRYMHYAHYTERMSEGLHSVAATVVF